MTSAKDRDHMSYITYFKCVSVYFNNINQGTAIQPPLSNNPLNFTPKFCH